MKHLLTVFCCCAVGLLSAQEIEETQPTQSNIQTYTPSKLLSKGQWDIKWFNNLYTETKSINENKVITTIDRQNFFTASLDIFTGVSDNNRLNLGLLLEYRSNTNSGKNILAPFSFKSAPFKRSGLSSIAPAIKFVPFPAIERFAIQTAFSIPLFKNEVEEEFISIKKDTPFKTDFSMTTLLPTG